MKSILYHPFGSNHDIHEVAYVLTERYNDYAEETTHLPQMDSQWVTQQLSEQFDPSDLEALVDDEFTRGLVMGQLLAIYIQEETDGTP